MNGGASARVRRKGCLAVDTVILSGFPCLVCAGIPAWIGWIRYLSFIYYGFGMLLHIEYQGRTVYSCIDPNVSATGAMSVQVSLPYLNVKGCQLCISVLC
jgi:hypothetical protein